MPLVFLSSILVEQKCTHMYIYTTHAVLRIYAYAVHLPVYLRTVLFKDETYERFGNWKKIKVQLYKYYSMLIWTKTNNSNWRWLFFNSLEIFTNVRCYYFLD